MAVKKRKSDAKAPTMPAPAAHTAVKRRSSIEESLGDSRLSWVLCILIIGIVALGAQQYAVCLDLQPVHQANIFVVGKKCGHFRLVMPLT